VTVAVQLQGPSIGPAAQEHHHRHDPVGLAELREVGAVVNEAVDREPLRIALLLDDE
jgi:hypothetical protein